jgi:hypothetical protein
VNASFILLDRCGIICGSVTPCTIILEERVGFRDGETDCGTPYLDVPKDLIATVRVERRGALVRDCLQPVWVVRSCSASAQGRRARTAQTSDETGQVKQQSRYEKLQRKHVWDWTGTSTNAVIDLRISNIYTG